MKIGIVAPSPVPFTIGGAENLWWGLLEYLNQCTPHQCELIKVPSRELGFWDLLDTYREFSRLDLSHFDLVISGKYPAWMVQHPNHVCYMLHCLRGLYDTYHFAGLPNECDTSQPEVAALVSFMQRHYGDPAMLDAFFDRAERLRKSGAAPETFAFPGPLIRQAVHFLDAIGLAPSRIRKYSAIARNVVRRKSYFPPGANVEVAYPPSNLRSFRSGAADYFLSVGRLDGAKRTRLLVEAMLLSKTKVPLKIAGLGPDRESLLQLAEGDSRIQFLGFVNDGDLTGLYADALAILYVPYDEDYGLVTIEAMASGKPVLTVTDSGGPLEFVRDGENGYVVDPSPRAVAERLDYMSRHRDVLLSMASNCRNTVQSVSWETAASVLLQEPGKKLLPFRNKRKRKITVATTFPVYPPRGGGQGRVYHLYRNLTSEFDIDIVSFSDHLQTEFDEMIAPGVREVRIPKSLAHAQTEWRLTRRLAGVPATDVMMPKLFSLTPAYVKALARSAAGSDWLVASHPYLLPALESVRHDQRILYEAQDVEAELKKTILPANRMGRYFLKLTASTEERCCGLSSLIITCSQQDSRSLGSLYGIDPAKVLVVSNGADLSSVNFCSWPTRRKARQNSSSPRPFTVLFMASWHGPNIEAVLCLIQIARLLPQVDFLLLGSIGSYLEQYGFHLPPNVISLGVVDDQTKDQILSWADLAVNPMQSGSGTNIKMLDYMAAGVPVLSTFFGARGLGIEDRTHVRLATLLDFPKVIEELRTQDSVITEAMVERARAHVVLSFSWEVIAQGLMARLLPDDKARVQESHAAGA